MLTELEPEYKFVDGKAIVVGEYPQVVEGSVIKVYIPSMMTEIECTPKEETLYCMDTTGNTIFLNENHPTFPDVAIATTCVPAKVTDDLVIKVSNIELHETDGFNGDPIKYIPRVVRLKPGSEVAVNSDLGVFKDLQLY